jgi:FKBP-type peptidyl-prolyl cis-trans isomerase
MQTDPWNCVAEESQSVNIQSDSVESVFGGSSDMKLASGIDIEDVVVGAGEEASKGSMVSVKWRGTLNRGDEFGGGESKFRVGSRDVVAGLSNGVVGMRVGGTRRVRVSPHLAYRDQAVPGIPANAVLNFEVQLLNVTRAPE